MHPVEVRGEIHVAESGFKPRDVFRLFDRDKLAGGSGEPKDWGRICEGGRIVHESQVFEGLDRTELGVGGDSQRDVGI